MQYSDYFHTPDPTKYVPFFAPMKRKRRKLLSDWKLTLLGQRYPTLPKSEFPRLLNSLWNEILPTLGADLQSGFLKCDIYPTNVEPLLKHLRRTDELNLFHIGQEFIDFIQNAIFGVFVN